jgi:hypothetical protein
MQLIWNSLQPRLPAESPCARARIVLVRAPPAQRSTERRREACELELGALLAALLALAIAISQ